MPWCGLLTKGGKTPSAVLLMMRLAFLLWPQSHVSQASPSDPWAFCSKSNLCKSKFADGQCDKECVSPACLIDGFDCITDKSSCNPAHVQYCRNHYDNSHCDHGCNSPACGWDGSDCHRNRYSKWAKGTLIIHTRIPFQRGTFQNTSLLWAVSTILRTAVKLRGMAPFSANKDVFALDTQTLSSLLTQTSSYDVSGSLLYLQVDNRPCSSHTPPTCFAYASEAANFFRVLVSKNPPILSSLPEVQAIVQAGVRGVLEDIGNREEDEVEEEKETRPAWFWPVVGVAVGLGLALVVIVVVSVIWRRRRRQRRGRGERVHHRSTVTENNNGSKAWTRRTNSREERGRGGRERDRNGLKKKKKEKESGKRRREPLGEDAIQLRTLRKDLDIGSDTDMTQSSMEDVRFPRRQEDASICDHRSPEQKHFRLNSNHQQVPMLAPPRGWERNATPHQRTPNNSAPVQWCGPDGSVVLIRAVRSGLDRVVLELLRAGVPVNNTDHTGRSALHWACSVNHLSLTRTLIRYGAAVDLQDHKGETPLFLSALHGCYDTARFLLLNGANQDLTDRRGRSPLDVSREGLHHQVHELLLAHRVQRGPVPIDLTTEVLWDDRAYMYSPWMVSPPSLPGRSASFSGVIGHRELSSPQPSDWQMVRGQCASPQNWRPMPNQSATALVTPRILGHPSRPISTLQEVTSEAEEEDREMPQEVPRAATPHFLSPQPAPRQRSFSCTQHALQRRSSGNHSDLPITFPIEPPANEHVEIVVVPHPKEAANQSENRTSGPVPSIPQRDPERESARNSSQKPQSERLNNDTAKPAQAAL
ncbi:neurogenic locus notch homolog protein 1 [Chanos chanos]|uniref:Neurogenic locus notch homolog protein 1 n=1 Tax=Chanos chanos TaxID=29144 RepID=A0A6J2WCA3_CHACN|nr:neurogenic locus notch homolog protein 1-like [Chanos chanos]